MKHLFARLPFPTLAALVLFPILLLIDALCYQVTLPLEIGEQHGIVTVTVGSTHLTVKAVALPQSLQFVSHDPLVHEYQIDGSDSVYNRDLDTAYFRQIANAPYYRWQAWMRDLAGMSRWRDLEIEANGHKLQRMTWPANGQLVPLPNTSNLRIRVQLQRPETPMALDLTLRDDSTLQIMLNRNLRQITISELDQNTNRTVASAFFPQDATPFAAMVLDTLVRILLWATLLLLAVQVSEMALGWAIGRIGSLLARGKGEHSQHDSQGLSRFSLAGSVRRWRIISWLNRFRQALHPCAWLALAGSLVYVSWIARVEYGGQPHIYDASAYLFSAKIYASGHLSAPAPPTSTLFPGPFMVIFQGRWFGQYEPGTALTLVPGLWLGVPWLVEPILGTLALLGIGLIAARLYNRQVATLAVLLGCLSPFYSYLAASYLSHAVALFYLVWGLWALLCFAQGGAGWNLPICACCFGMATLTRDLVALLFIVLLVPGVILLMWQKQEKGDLPQKRLKWWLISLSIGLIFYSLYLGYNFLLTGDTLITPRYLFSSGDTWGFGRGIGFYGQHTLAAGFVNLDELLTSLQIDLFGWPFYFTLAFMALPFLTGRVQKADWFLLIALVVTTGSYIGYFYNGIYLGPRYLFEDLPFLLILSARGMLTLGAWGMENRQALCGWLRRSSESSAHIAPSAVTLILVSALVFCNLLYYTPRQIVRYQNYTGLPDLTKLETNQIYHPPVHHAIVVTDDLAIYQMVLFPLNDPMLKGDVIYAWGETTEQLQTLQRDFPTRTLYLLVVYPDGSIQYIRSP